MAISQALKDAGIPFSAVDAAYIGNVSSGLYDARRVIQQFGWTGIPITHLVQASASGSAAFREAFLMVDHEVWQIALVVGFEKMERGLLPGSAGVMTGRHHLDVLGLDAIPARVALEMKKRMERFRETPEMFAQVAVQACASIRSSSLCGSCRSSRSRWPRWSWRWPVNSPICGSWNKTGRLRRSPQAERVFTESGFGF